MPQVLPGLNHVLISFELAFQCADRIDHIHDLDCSILHLIISVPGVHHNVVMYSQNNLKESPNVLGSLFFFKLHVFGEPGHLGCRS